MEPPQHRRQQQQQQQQQPGQQIGGGGSLMAKEISSLRLYSQVPHWASRRDVLLLTLLDAVMLLVLLVAVLGGPVPPAGDATEIDTTNNYSSSSSSSIVINGSFSGVSGGSGDVIIISNSSSNSTISTGGVAAWLPGGFEYVALLLVAAATVHALAFLFDHWFVGYRCAAAYRPVATVAQATHVLVTPAANRGRPELCRLTHRSSASNNSNNGGGSYTAAAAPVKAAASLPINNAEQQGPSHEFEFQKRRFVYDPALGTFRKLRFPVSLPFADYAAARGYRSTADIAAARAAWGDNRVELPTLRFWDLYREQALAPFFVFQVFCVALWCLDEYWYYALFTLGLLLLFEASVAHSRLRNAAALRSLAAAPPQSLLCYRLGRWSPLPAEQLLPGDLVSVLSASSSPPPAALPPAAAASGSPAAAVGGGGKRTPQQQQQQMIVPADLLLLRGSVVVNEAMLTGESTPHLKEPPSALLTAAAAATTATAAGGRSQERLRLRDDKQLHVLFAGTRVVQHQPPSRSSSSSAAGPSHAAADSVDAIPLPDDGGCVGYVLRSGFYTGQGKLMRTLLYGAERVTANSTEALLFILFLLQFALAAAAYVLYFAWNDPARPRYKTLVNVTLIVTSVVPPELPMELSLAVNNSLLALQRLAVFCTEPFRIPWAGKVDVCCFDKTGTLTVDHLILNGVAGLDESSSVLLSSDAASAARPLPRLQDVATTACDETRYVIAGCHSVISGSSHSQPGQPQQQQQEQHTGQLLGDPVEIAALNAINWAFRGDTAVARNGRGSVRIVARHHFASALQRMSAVVSLEHHSPPQLLAVAKGAPERLREFLSSVPAGYDATYRHFALQGCRVLALGSKPLPSMRSDQARQLSREDVERDLQFAGFLVFSSPLKRDSKASVELLLESSHAVSMITGDNALTACQVAREVGIVQRKLLLLSADGEWTDLAGEPCETFDANRLSPLSEQFDLCVTGASLALWSSAVAQRSLANVKVFARVNPHEKEWIVAAIKSAGHVALMCGDGTNDVGALKQAHVGVALLSAPVKPGIGAAAASTSAAAGRLPSSQQLRRRPGAKELAAAQPVASPAVAAATAPAARPSSGNERLQSLRRQLEAEGDGMPAVPQVGDASLAAPFTSKISSVVSVVHILRQGRCTLVTTLQMFKILALNCLISAYSLSVLYLEGVKLGDGQATAAGMLIAVCFLFVSRSQPLERLSKERPPTRVFSPYMLLSIAGQFVVHLSCLMLVVAAAQALPYDKLDPDAEFVPNLVNSAVFLQACAMQLVTFAVNYQGHPFMQSLRENRPLMYALAVGGLGTLAFAAELSPELNASFELVPFPSAKFRSELVGLIVADAVLCYAWEWMSHRFLPA